MIRATKSSVLALAFATASFAGALVVPGDARACGGVFVQATENPTSRTIVRDHRMAIAIGRTKTVIWDEVRLEGDPQDFVWITPVRPGTKIEIADDEWLSALDVSTQPVVYAPLRDSSGGCALAGCGADEDTSKTAPGNSIFVLKEEVLGPYDSVTVRAAGDPDAPYRWLVANGYKIDDDKVRSTLASYASAGFDFAALKLHATCNQTSMQPVRIVIPGTDPRILIRMALAGARLDAVPITLFVIAEAPYRPTRYPFGFINDDALEWDRPSSSSSSSYSSSSSSGSSAYYAPRSNYDALANDVMAKDGRTWLVEATQLAVLSSGTTYDLPTPPLYEAYSDLCSGKTPSGAALRSGSNPTSTSSPTTVKSPCPTVDAGGNDAATDGSTDAGDGGDGGDDGGDDAGDDASLDASSDAATAGDADAGDGGFQQYDAGEPTSSAMGCHLSGTDSDFSVATRDVVGTQKIWVTRLRARIEPNALVDDLDLTPAIAPDDQPISNLHQVARYEDEADRPSKRSCAASKVVKRNKHAPAGTWALGAAAAFVLTAWLRRKKRR